MADAGSSHSFIDIAAWDGVREQFLSAKPIAVFSRDLETLLWANGRAAALFGFASIGEFEAEGPAGLRIALRQVRAAADMARGEPARTMLRVTSGVTSKLLPAAVSHITGRDGTPGVMVVIDAAAGEQDANSQDGNGQNGDDTALAAIAGLADEGAAAAIVDASGMLVAADPLFADLSFPEGAIGDLVRDVRNEEDRLVKRLILPRPTMPVAVAIVRLTDEPVRHLIMAVRASETDDEPDEPVVVEPAPERAGPETALPEMASPGIAMAEIAEAEIAEAEIAEAGIAEPDLAPSDETSGAALQNDESAGGEDASAIAREAAATPEPADTQPPVAEAATGIVAETTPSAPVFVADFENLRGPVRFSWRTSAEGRFTEISPEFATAVGPNAADIVGRDFEEVASALDLDPSGEISASLTRHDTWSGKSVWWPVEGTAYRVPVDLAALPSYNRERVFEGYRGFGIVRMGERRPDEGERGLSLAAPVVAAPETPPSGEPAEAALAEKPSLPDDPFRGEVPALATVSPQPMRRESDKIIDLATKRRDHTAGEALSATERAAFRQIGDVLGWARVEPSSAAPRDGAELAGADTAEAAAHDDLSPADAGTDEPTAAVTDVVEEVPHAEAEVPGDEALEAADEDAPTDEEPADRHDYMPSAFATGRDDADEGADGLTPDFLDALPLAVLIHREDRALYANAVFAEMTGYETPDALNAAGGIDALFAGEPAGDGALSLVGVDGRIVGVRAHLQTVPWRGRTALMFAFEERKQAAETPAAEQTGISEAAELRAILDTATDGVVVLSRDGVIRSINGSASALFGYAGEEVEGKGFGVLFAQESQLAAVEYLNGLAHNGVASVLNEGLEVLGREKHGGFLPLFMTIGRLETSDGFCAVVRDITAWKQTEQALRDAQRTAEDASSQKSDFLAKISHEIRTPLNAIIGFSELMAEERFGPVGNERYKSYLADINKSGKYVLDLVNDLLDISKIEAGKQELEFESVSLNEAVGEAVTMIQPQANRNRIIIRSSLDEDLPGVVADERSIKQIVLNILSNSVRFTHSGGQVIISTSYNARGEVVLRIKDTGIGMSAKEIETALQPFQQVASLGRARGDGTGLGLPLTKALVEANRAEFAIQSEPGRGTAVEIVFPPSRVLAS